MCHCQNQVWANKVATTGGRSVCMSSLLRTSNLLVIFGFVGLSVQRWPHLTVLSVSQRSKSWRISLVFWHVRKNVLVDFSVLRCIFHKVSNCTNQLTTKCQRNPTAAATEAFSSSSIWQHTSTCVCFLPLLSVTERGLSHHPINMEQNGETLSHFVGLCAKEHSW